MSPKIVPSQNRRDRAKAPVPGAAREAPTRHKRNRLILCLRHHATAESNPTIPQDNRLSASLLNQPRPGRVERTRPGRLRTGNCHPDWDGTPAGFQWFRLSLPGPRPEKARTATSRQSGWYRICWLSQERKSKPEWPVAQSAGSEFQCPRIINGQPVFG